MVKVASAFCMMALIGTASVAAPAVPVSPSIDPQAAESRALPAVIVLALREDEPSRPRTATMTRPAGKPFDFTIPLPCGGTAKRMVC
jgi:hypothetical protein